MIFGVTGQFRPPDRTTKTPIQTPLDSDNPPPQIRTPPDSDPPIQIPPDSDPPPPIHKDFA